MTIKKLFRIENKLNDLLNTFHLFVASLAIDEMKHIYSEEKMREVSQVLREYLHDFPSPKITPRQIIKWNDLSPQTRKKVKYLMAAFHSVGRNAPDYFLILGAPKT